jgi:hypothetical protein
LWELAGEKMQYLLDKYELSDKPVFVTEWNVGAGMNVGAGSRQDTNESGAYMARQLFLAQQDQVFSKIFVFAPVEGQIFNDWFLGDLGLFTSRGHVKSSGQVFGMYNRLMDEILQSKVKVNSPLTNKNLYGIATRDKSTNKAALLLWNYNKSVNKVRLSLRDLPPAGTWKVTRYQMDEYHGNVYHDYEKYKGFKPTPHEMLGQDFFTFPGSDFAIELWMMPDSVVEFILEPLADAKDLSPIRQNPVYEINLAAEAPVTASSTLEEGGWKAAALTDGFNYAFVTSMGWSTKEPSPQAETNEWVSVDLGESKNVGRVVLYPRNDTGNEQAGFPVDFKIQCAANENGAWQDLTIVNDYHVKETLSGARTFTFEAIKCRYVRIFATQLSKVTKDGYGMQLSEMEVYSH